MWYTTTYISLKFEISWTLAFPTNLFKLQLTKSAEQLQYVNLCLFHDFDKYGLIFMYSDWRENEIAD